MSVALNRGWKDRGWQGAADWPSPRNAAQQGTQQAEASACRAPKPRPLTSSPQSGTRPRRATAPRCPQRRCRQTGPATCPAGGRRHAAARRTAGWPGTPGQVRPSWAAQGWHRGGVQRPSPSGKSLRRARQGGSAGRYGRPTAAPCVLRQPRGAAVQRHNHVEHRVAHHLHHRSRLHGAQRRRLMPLPKQRARLSARLGDDTELAAAVEKQQACGSQPQGHPNPPPPPTHT